MTTSQNQINLLLYQKKRIRGRNTRCHWGLYYGDKTLNCSENKRRLRSFHSCIFPMTFSGALFDGEDVTPLEAAFQHGINMVNDDRAVLMRSRVFGTIDKIPQARDSFKASKKGSSDCIL